MVASGAGKSAQIAGVEEQKIPPAWLENTKVDWDTNRPWNEARLEVRRLLALDEASVRKAVKLTWLYAQKGDIGDGHELPLYLFLSGNYAWALKEYPRYLARQRGKGPTHGYMCYASCLAHFGDFDAALKVLEDAQRDLPPKPWTTNSLANIHHYMGDLYARRGNMEMAREHYAEARRLYPLSDQPYGRHLLPRKVAQIQAKEKMLVMGTLTGTPLRDGDYSGRAVGYSDKEDIVVSVTVQQGRLSRLDVRHKEKIDLNAPQIIPQRILEKQSLKVDGISGATITTDAIVEATYRALLQAGLK
jgi:uncharacterized protein with FMN-binding domain